MSLLNSRHTFHSLRHADEATFRKEVDRITKRSDQPSSSLQSRKRSDSDSQSQPRKRARASQDSAYGTQNESGEAWSGTSGTIIKLELVNFMCHQHLEIEFNSKINFIVGRNGSGKSAILTALVVALGGTALNTGRGTSLKDFIKKGQQSAEVTIHINNTGIVSFKRDVYGDRIIVKRTITMSGGSIRLCSSSRKVISKQMADLRHMTMTLGIQVDNPISVLDQNTSRHFLKQSKPEVKYELFMRATNLETLQIRYAETSKHLGRMQFEINAKEKQLQESEKEVKEAERKYNMFANLEKDRETKDLLELELLWAQARDRKSALSQSVSELKKVQDILQRLEQSASGGEIEEKLIRRMEDLKSKMDDLLGQEKGIEQQAQSMKIKMNSLKEQNRQCQQDQKKLDDYIKHEEEILKAYKTEIDSQLKKMHPDYIEQRRKQRELVEVLQKRLQENENSQVQKKAEGERVRNELMSCKENASRLVAHKQSLESQIRTARRELQCLQSDQSNLAVYGQSIPELVQRIERAHCEGKFRKKPVGPLGSFIKVRDPKWALAIESCIGGKLRSFVVDSISDRRVLLQIMEQMNFGNQQPAVTTTRFLDQVHDVKRGSVQCENYKNILSNLEISSPVVANVLIDTFMVEKTLLFPSDNECQALLSETHLVPQNCRLAYTIKGDQYFPAPNYRTYAAQGSSRARYLQASREEVIRHAAARINEMQRSIMADQVEYQTFSQQEKEAKQKLALLQRDIKSLQESSLDIKKDLNRILDQEQPDQNSVAALQKELEEKKQKLDVSRRAADEYPLKSKSILDELESCKEEMKNWRFKLEEVKSQQEPLRMELTKCKEEEAEMKSVLSQKKRKLEQYKKRAAELESLEAQLKEEWEKAHEEAQRLDTFLREHAQGASKEYEDMSETERPVQIIERQLRTIVQKLQKFTETIGDSEDNVTQDYLDKKNVFNKTKTMLTQLQGNAAALLKALKIRKGLYLTQKNWNSAVVSHQFTRVLRYRNFTGSLEFNAEKKILNIKVGPVDGGSQAGMGTESLSGGERSYATTAFIIALWDVTQLPFYFMDEFDVFMDQINRNLVFSLLLRFSKEKSAYQFGFLTPCDTTMVDPGPDVEVHKLQDPRK